MKKLFLLLLCASAQIQSMEYLKSIKNKFNSWREQRLRNKAEKEFHDLLLAKKWQHMGSVDSMYEGIGLEIRTKPKLCKHLHRLYGSQGYGLECNTLIEQFGQELKKSRQE